MEGSNERRGWRSWGGKAALAVGGMLVGVVLAKYPRATVLRVETDSDGVYEAHLTTSGGKRVTVEVDKSFKVTGEESGPGHP